MFPKIHTRLNDLLLESFVLTRADLLELLAVSPGWVSDSFLWEMMLNSEKKEFLRYLIKINGNAQFFGCFLSESLCALHTLLSGNICNGNKWANIDSTHARVCSTVLGHIDQFL